MFIQQVGALCSCCLDSIAGGSRSQNSWSGSKGPHTRKAPLVTAPVILRLIIYFFCSLYVGWLFRVSRTRPGGVLCGLLPLLPVCTNSVVLRGAEYGQSALLCSQSSMPCSAFCPSHRLPSLALHICLPLPSCSHPGRVPQAHRACPCGEPCGRASAVHAVVLRPRRAPRQLERRGQDAHHPPGPRTEHTCSRHGYRPNHLNTSYLNTHHSKS